MSKAIYWSEKEDAILMEKYPTASWDEIKLLFPGRPLRGIRCRASRLGVAAQRRKDIRVYPLKHNGSMIGHLSEVERSYLAGIIDGEGCFSFYRYLNKKTGEATYRMYFTIANTSQVLMDWLKEKIPGNNYLRARTREQESHRTCYTWILAGNGQVMIFCKEIAPYLLIKREQAELLAQGYLMFSEEERVALVVKMAALKRTA